MCVCVHITRYNDDRRLMCTENHSLCSFFLFPHRWHQIHQITATKYSLALVCTVLLIPSSFFTLFPSLFFFSHSISTCLHIECKASFFPLLVISTVVLRHKSDSQFIFVCMWTNHRKKTHIASGCLIGKGLEIFRSSTPISVLTLQNCFN